MRSLRRATLGMLLLSPTISELPPIAAAENETATQPDRQVTEFLAAPPADVSADAIPLTWSPETNIAWQADLKGYGQSSPVVWGEQVYISTISGENKEQCHLAAYDLATGEQKWLLTKISPAQRPNNVYASRAAPTPVVDKDGIVCYWEEGLVVATDHAGSEIWSLDLVEKYGKIDSQFGTSSSLRMLDNRVYVWVERNTDPYLAALNRSNGEVLWKVAGLGTTAWSSPTLLPVDGTTHLVLSGDGKIAGLDPETGDKLWSTDDISGNTTPSPIVVGDGAFLIGASPGRAQTVPAGIPESNGLMQVSRDGESWKAEWKWHDTRATSSFASPLAYKGVAYFVNRAGVAYGIDLETGEELFVERIAESPWATPVGVGDRVYIFGSKGTTTVLAAGKEFKELAENKLWEPDQPEPEAGGRPNPFGGSTLYSGVVLDNGLLIRNGTKLFRLTSG